MDLDPAFDPSRPFTRAQGLRAGLTGWDMRSRRFVRLQRNVYVATGADVTLPKRATAALLVAPRGAIVSHFTAAELWGGAVPSSSSVWVTIRRSQAFTGAGVRVHQSDRVRETTRRFGLTLTSPEQTFIDLARHLDLVQLVVLGDRLVRREVTTTDRLMRAASQWSGHHQQLVCAAAAHVRAGVDSPPESRLRMLIVMGGLPEPAVNYAIRDEDTGDILRRFELAYVKHRLAIEYEGQFHRGDPDVWARDINRREDLDRRAWRVVQVIAPGLHQSPHVTLARVERARVDCGAKPTPLLSEEWKRYFPGRSDAS